jgi:hypothetical protein
LNHAPETEDLLASKSFVFIIGAPRSGTTMLQILLANHPSVATTFELTAINKYIVPWLKTWRWEQEQVATTARKKGLVMLWNEEENRAFLRGFLNRVYARVLAKNPSATHLLEKHPSNSLWTPTIRELIPGARFLHIIRDGRDVAASLVATNGEYGFGTPNIASAARLWRKFLEQARTAQPSGQNYHEVRYEDLLAEPTRAYGAALDFCGLAYEADWLQANLDANTFDKMKERRAAPDAGRALAPVHYRTGRAGSWKEQFSNSDCFQFDRIAGDLLRELGYAERDWWGNSAAQRRHERLRFVASQLQYSLQCAARGAQSGFEKGWRPVSDLFRSSRPIAP